MNGFEVPACEHLRYLRSLRRQLRHTGIADAAPQVLPQQITTNTINTSNVTNKQYSYWDGPAWLRTEGQLPQADSGVQTAVENLGRSYTARGLTAITYAEMNPADTNAFRILAANPMRRMVAVACSASQFFVGFSPNQVNIDSFGFGQFRGVPSNTGSNFQVFTDDVWGAWVQQEVWVTTNDITMVLSVWDEVYVSWKPPTVS